MYFRPRSSFQPELLDGTLAVAASLFLGLSTAAPLLLRYAHRQPVTQEIWFALVVNVLGFFSLLLTMAVVAMYLRRKGHEIRFSTLAAGALWTFVALMPIQTLMEIYVARAAWLPVIWAGSLCAVMIQTLTNIPFSKALAIYLLSSIPVLVLMFGVSLALSPLFGISIG